MFENLIKLFERLVIAVEKLAASPVTGNPPAAEPEKKAEKKAAKPPKEEKKEPPKEEPKADDDSWADDEGGATEKKVTRDELKKKLIELQTKKLKSGDKIRQWLKEHTSNGTTEISGIPADEYDSLYAEAEAALKA